MTQKNILSVRNTEAAAINNIPSFDDVYAMTYIQESIRSFILENSRNYPMMAPYEDDIRQEMLIYLARSLDTFDPGKSDIKTYCRLALITGLRRARRDYFTETQKSISLAIPLDKLVAAEQESQGCSALMEIRRDTDCYADEPFFHSEKREAFYAALAKLSAKDRAIAKRIMEGMTLSDICDSGLCCRRYLFDNALQNMRQVFKKYFF